jgi:hypothetical protein
MIWKVRAENNLHPLNNGFQGAFYHKTHNHSINCVDFRIELYPKKRNRPKIHLHLGDMPLTLPPFTKLTTEQHQRPSTSNFIQIGHEIWKSRVEIPLRRSAKRDRLSLRRSKLRTSS